MVNVGQKIRKHRETADISQKKLGIALGLSDKAISAYESGRTLPPIETLFRIAEELNIPVEYLITEETRETRIDERLNKIEEILKQVSGEIAKLKDDL